MSALMGWAAPDAKLPSHLASLHIERRDAMVEVWSDRPVAGARDYLSMIQTCYQALDSFVPRNPGARSVEHVDPLSVLADLSGFGQLRMVYAAPETVSREVASSGQEFLRRRRAENSAHYRWKTRTEAAFERIANALPMKRRQVSWSSGGMIQDVLLPRWCEFDLSKRVSMAVSTVGAPDLDGHRLVISGLWAPVAFVDKTHG